MPTYLEHNTFAIGNVVYPLPTSTGNDLYIDADPAVSNMLFFLQAVINKYAGARWTQAATAAQIKDASGNIIAQPVTQIVPFGVADYLEDTQWKFPLLSLDRMPEKYTDRSRGYFQAATKLELLYVLPPMTPAQMYQLNSFRKVIRDIILDRLLLGYDAVWKNQAILWEVAGFAELDILDGNYLGIQHTKNVNEFFPTFIMHMTMVERSNQVPNTFPPLDNITGAISTGDGYQPSDLTLINFDLNLP